MVGAPLLGLLAILTAGEQLVPPHGIGGSWLVEPALASPCVLGSDPQASVRMNVSQSGPRAEVALTTQPETQLSVRLLDDSLSGSGAAPVVAGCDGEVIELTGQLRLTDSASIIAGTLSRVGCPSCAPVEFLAARQNRSEE